MDDVGVQYALRERKKDTDKIRKRISSLRKVHTICSEEVIEKIVSYIQADIEERYYIYKAKVSANKCRAIYTEIKSLIAEKEGFFCEEHDVIVPEILSVVKEGVEISIEEGKKLIESSLAFAKGEEVEWPSCTPEEFINDLKTFLAVNDYTVIEEVVKNPVIAKEYYEDESIPKPIRFLARIVLMVNEVKIEKVRAPNNGFMGFVAA